MPERFEGPLSVPARESCFQFACKHPRRAQQLEALAPSVHRSLYGFSADSPRPPRGPLLHGFRPGAASTARLVLKSAPGRTARISTQPRCSSPFLATPFNPESACLRTSAAKGVHSSPQRLGASGPPRPAAPTCRCWSSGPLLRPDQHGGRTVLGLTGGGGGTAGCAGRWHGWAGIRPRNARAAVHEAPQRARIAPGPLPSAVQLPVADRRPLRSPVSSQASTRARMAIGPWTGPALPGPPVGAVVRIPRKRRTTRQG